MEYTHASVGYTVAHPFEPPGWLGQRRLSSRILTASRCLAPLGPGPWALSWTNCTPEHRLKEANRLGVDPGALPALDHWLQTQMDNGLWGWPRWFASVSVARDFARQFLSGAGDAVILGVGLLDVGAQPLLEQYPDSLEPGTPGIVQFLRTGRELDPGGNRLGYEPLAEEYGDFHSWLCFNAEAFSSSEGGPEINAAGLIDRPEQATEVAERLGTALEGEQPHSWYPALLVSYPVG